MLLLPAKKVYKKISSYPNVIIFKSRANGKLLLSWHITVCIAEGQVFKAGSAWWKCFKGLRFIFHKDAYRKRSHQTNDESKLKPMPQCPALAFGNAMLYARLYSLRSIFNFHFSVKYCKKYFCI